MRSDAVADKLLEFFDVWKAAAFRPRPEKVVTGPHLEDASSAWNERHFANLILKSCEQLLRHPCGTQKPPALGAVAYFNSRALGYHGFILASTQRG